MITSNGLSWNKIFNFYLNLTGICAQTFRYQLINIGSGNGLAPNRRQAILLTYIDQNIWRHMGALEPKTITTLMFKNQTSTPK